MAAVSISATNRPCFAGAYASIMDSAREFGDYETADAAQRALDQDCGRGTDGGVLRYSKGSNLSNIMAARARVHRRDDFRIAVRQGPPESALRGPILSAAKYPDVLVARAFSNGEDLDLVLYPGANTGVQNLRLERLRPASKYVMRNGAEQSFTADSNGAAELAIETPRPHAAAYRSSELSSKSSSTGLNTCVCLFWASTKSLANSLPVPAGGGSHRR